VERPRRSPAPSPARARPPRARRRRSVHQQPGDALLELRALRRPLVTWPRTISIDDAGAWLRSTAFVDSDASAIVAFARTAAGGRADARERAIALYYAVRDGVTYTPYCDFRSPDTYRASGVLAKGAGFCVGKAALLAAVARAEGIPARLRFADAQSSLHTAAARPRRR
jgi:transglutaminase-like putative cysteine protease